MPTLTIRKFSENDKHLLRIRAAHNARSMEEEARVILHHSLIEEMETPPQSLVTAIHDIFEEFEIDGIDLPDVPRDLAPEPPIFK